MATCCVWCLAGAERPTLYRRWVEPRGVIDVSAFLARYVRPSDSVGRSPGCLESDSSTEVELYRLSRGHKLKTDGLFFTPAGDPHPAGAHGRARGVRL